MPTIDATVGGASANSFMTETEWIEYMAARLNVPTGTTVTGSNCTETEKKAMIEATRDINRLAWKGTRVNSTQALSWPRDEVTNPDLPWATQEQQTTYYYATTVIPDRVKNAQAELSLEFLKAGTEDIAAAEPESNIKREKTDVLETEYFERADRVTGLARYPRVITEVLPLIEVSTGLTVQRQ